MDDMMLPIALYIGGSIAAGFVHLIKSKWTPDNIIIFTIIILPVVNLWLVYISLRAPIQQQVPVRPPQERLSQRRKPSIIVHQGLPSRQEAFESETEQ